MLYSELLDIAKRRGIVKWLYSGRIETVRYSETTGCVAARNILGGPVHPIRPLPDDSQMDCLELSPKTLITLGALLAQKPKDV